MIASLRLKEMFLAVLLTLFVVSVASAAEDKIGFMDIHRVLSSHPKYNTVQKQLDTFIQKKVEAAGAAAAKETDPRKKQEILETARRESGKEELRVMNPLTDDINKVVAKVAQSKGVTVVLNKVLIYYGGVDLTEDITKALKELK